MITALVMHKIPYITFSLDKLTEVKSTHPGAGIWIYMMFIFSLVFHATFSDILDFNLTYFYLLFGIFALYLTYISINNFDEEMLNKVAFRIASRKNSYAIFAFIKFGFWVMGLPIILVKILHLIYELLFDLYSNY